MNNARYNERNLKLAFWNANSLINKKQELTIFLEGNRIDIMLINETYLKTTKDFKIRNYTVYRRDREEGKGGGTAILVKRGLEHGELPGTGTKNIEETGIKIKTKRGELKVYSVYKSPTKTLEEEEIKSFFQEQTATIVAGDLNSKHEDWNCRTANTNGKKLRQIAEKHSIMIVAPEEPTHICTSTGTVDVLDIAMLKNVPWQTEIRAVMDLSSDHSPVILEVHIEAENIENERKRTNWKMFKENMETKKITIGDANELEQAIQDLENRIKEAERKATKMLAAGQKRPLPTHIHALIAEKKRAKKKYMRTMHPDDKRTLNNLNNKVKEEIRQMFNEKWDEKIEALTTEDQSLWKMAGALTGKKKRTNIPYLKREDKVAITNKEKADTFADSLEEQFKTNKPNQDVIFNRNIENIGRRRETTNENEEIMEITKEEVQEIIAQLPSRKAPGIDGIKNQALKNLPEEAIEEITEIAKGVMRTEHYPSNWKTAEAIMIPKTGKPKNDPSSYRPISLLSSMSKVIEKLIYKRLRNFAEQKNIIPSHQFGFRSEHATTHQLARLTENIKENMNISKPTAATFMDIEKAFDKVWHEAMIYKMKRTKFPNKLVNITASYLRDRKFTVRIENAKSEERPIEAGVPQGSILGPLLYNIYISDIPELKHSKIAQFADDTAIYTSHRNKKCITKRLQEDTNKLVEYFEKWRIKINANKSVAVYFDHKNRRKDTEKPEEIKIANQKVEWKNEAKYLGVLIDKNLKFHSQMEENAKKARQLQGYLYPLLNRSSKLSLENKMKIIKQ
ncbi:hypothetical protein HHI36_024319 [Cryptolaemus montrouzieri]|uniref:Reverse transcriptase domain-containing protein n=1 Tax=Cryptolaemus montrouzieri TaxID=559131 RepID=A0ABD2MMQ9_9CUCU